MTFWSGILQGGARAVVASPSDLPPSVIAEFSSTLTQKERGKLLKRFGAGKVKCLVCGLVGKDSSHIFACSRHLFFLDLVRWESLKTFNKRCYKCCSLRFNHVFWTFVARFLKKSIVEVQMWWPVVSTSRRWRPWWITPLRRIFKRTSIVSGARHEPGRHEKSSVGEKVEECCMLIQFPCPSSWVSTGWRLTFCKCKVQHFFAAKHLNFSPVFSICRLHCAWLFLWWHEYWCAFRGFATFVHHFFNLAGGAYIYLRYSWWFGPFWEDAAWERWLLGAHQTLGNEFSRPRANSLWYMVGMDGYGLKGGTLKKVRASN